MDKDKMIEFAKEQCEIFPEDSYMGEYLRETVKMLQAEPCCNCIEFKRYAKEMGFEIEQEPCEDAISRAEAIRIASGYCHPSNVTKELANLPPVKPTQSWIPVNERLPKPYTYVNATCRSLVDDRENWVVETMYLPIPKENNEQGYSDWGNIPMLNWGKAEVIAWMERKIPEPYKEGEEE